MQEKTIQEQLHEVQLLASDLFTKLTNREISTKEYRIANKEINSRMKQVREQMKKEAKEKKLPMPDFNLERMLQKTLKKRQP
jgi:hypothetical protein